MVRMYDFINKTMNVWKCLMIWQSICLDFPRCHDNKGAKWYCLHSMCFSVFTRTELLMLDHKAVPILHIASLMNWIFSLPLVKFLHVTLTSLFQTIWLSSLLTDANICKTESFWNIYSRHLSRDIFVCYLLYIKLNIHPIFA
jgi:hypothetical protein